MNCKNCNAIIDDDAAFCSQCGAPVDKKAFCKNCGAEVNGAFCSKCGTKVTAEVAPTPAPVQELAPTPAPVHELAPTPAPVREEVLAPAPVAVKTAPTKGANKVMNIVAKSLAFFGAMMAFMFILFLGFDSVDRIGSFKERTPGNENIFYFFGENFDLLDYVSGYMSGWRRTYFFLSAYIRFFVALGGLVLITTFGIISIVKFVKSFSQDNDTVKASLRVMMFYVMVAAVMFAFHAESVSEEGEGSRRVVFNVATVIGLIFCALAIVGTLVCKLLENPSAFKNKANLINRIIALVAASVALITLILAANTGIGLDGDGLRVSSSPWGIADWDVEYFAIGSMAMMLMIVVLIFFPLMLFKNFKTIIGEKADTSLGLGIASAAISFVATVLLITLSFMAAADKDMRARLIRPILFLFFSSANLGAVIASKIIFHKNSEAD